MTNRISTPADARTVIVGVDTHKHVHVAVAIDSWGIRLRDQAFVADSAGAYSLRPPRVVRQNPVEQLGPACLLGSERSGRPGIASVPSLAGAPRRLSAVSGKVGTDRTSSV